jgi:diguanylate cyclase (GGDEF)-like protein
MHTLSSTNELPVIDIAPAGPDIVDLAEIDLDFAVDGDPDARAARPGELAHETAGAGDLAAVDLFRDVTAEDLAHFAAHAEVIRATPGCVLQAAGKLDERVFFVLAGQLRLYADPMEKRPRGIVDAGQSVGLHWALNRQPLEVAIVATEPSRVLVLAMPRFGEFSRRSHAFACNYHALLSAYLRGDNCLLLGARALAAMQQRRGYTDEATLLHNQRWLDTMLPRLLARSRFDKAPASIAMFEVDRLERLTREFGSVAGEQVQAAVGQLLLGIARTTDLLVCDDHRRFVAILPGTTLDGARIFCQRLRDGIRGLRVDAAENRALPSLTISSGIVQHDGEQSAAELLDRAATLVRHSRDHGGVIASA